MKCECAHTWATCFYPVRDIIVKESDELLNSGQVMFGEGAPELNWPNVPQAKPCLTTKIL